MPRPGVTREQVFEAADALVLEGQNSTVMAVRAKLGGGSPNTITPLLAEWRALHAAKQAEAMPSVPKPVEAVLRQVWGAAWKEAQSQLEAEREALSASRQEIERERTGMLAEITRLDTELEVARETIQKGDEALEEERRAHEQTKSERREARVLAEERQGRIAALEGELGAERRDHAKTQQVLTELRIEVATLTERAAQTQELRALVRSLQQQGRAAADQPKAAPRRRRKPQGSE